MVKSKFLFCILFLFGLVIADDVAFPMWPHWFTYFDAATFGMGNVNLFTTGPSAVLFNPANLDTIFSISTGYAYESRKSHLRSPWQDRNVQYYPQSVGLTIPRIGRGTIGILFYKTLKWQGSAENIEGDAHLMNLLLGFRYLVLSKLNLGITANYVFGNSNYEAQYDDANLEDNFSTHGIGIIVSTAFLLKRNTNFFLRFMSPIALRGRETYQSLDTLYTNSIEDNVPWEINLGIKYPFTVPLTIGSQITYRNWHRGGGVFIWGNHEWQLHGGLEFRPYSFLNIKLGTFIQQFYSDLEVPFLKFQQKGRAKVLFLTGGIGIKIYLMRVEIGGGKSVSIEHTDAAFNFYPERSLITVDITVTLEKLFGSS